MFEETGGSYPELITRGDIKLFMPPIGGLTVYVFGDPAKMSDPNVRLALRVHDECNGSDVFGSDICTCRPYLIFGIEEAVKEAQKGGSGVVIYFRKEGRALGEVTKYLVYNARKFPAGGETAGGGPEKLISGRQANVAPIVGVPMGKVVIGQRLIGDRRERILPANREHRRCEGLSLQHH